MVSTTRCSKWARRRPKSRPRFRPERERSGFTKQRTSSRNARSLGGRTAFRGVVSLACRSCQQSECTVETGTGFQVFLVTQGGRRGDVILPGDTTAFAWRKKCALRGMACLLTVANLHKTQQRRAPVLRPGGARFVGKCASLCKRIVCRSATVQRSANRALMVSIAGVACALW